MANKNLFLWFVTLLFCTHFVFGSDTFRESCRNECGDFSDWQQYFGCNCDIDCFERFDCCNDLNEECNVDEMRLQSNMSGVYFVDITPTNRDGIYDTSIINDNNQICNNDCALIYIHGFDEHYIFAFEQMTTVASFYREYSGSCDVYALHWYSDFQVANYDTMIRKANVMGNGIFSEFLTDFHNKCPNTKISIMAHSMGTRAAFNIIQNIDFTIDNIISVVGAVSFDSLESGNEYDSSTLSTDDIYVIYNNDDFALSFYPLYEGTLALGAFGAANPNAIPTDNVELLDYSDIWTNDHNAFIDENANSQFWEYFVPIIDE